MEGTVSMIVIALLAATVSCAPEGLLKRGYNDDHEGRGPTAFGMDGDDHDASIDDQAPCGLLHDNSGSREHGYDFDEPDQESRRGFSVKAAAAASSSSYK